MLTDYFAFWEALAIYLIFMLPFDIARWMAHSTGLAQRDRN